MSLSITINNINDLTDTERAVLRLIVGDKQVTLTGPTATRSFIESLGAGEDEDTDPLVPPAPVQNVATMMPSMLREAVVVSAPAAPIPASAELDSAGLPWDKRIHSSSRAKVADGTWRKMRGVDESLVATVEAELRAVQALRVTLPGDGSTVVADIPPGTTSIIVEVERDPATVVQHEDGVIPVPVPPPANSVVNPITGETFTEGELLMTAPSAPVPVPPAPTVTLAEMQAKLDAVAPPVPTPAAPLTFADLMKHVTPMLVSGKLPQDTLLAVTAEFGLPHLAALGARPDLVEAVRARIDEVVG